MVNLERHVQ